MLEHPSIFKRNCYTVLFNDEIMALDLSGKKTPPFIHGTFRAEFLTDGKVNVWFTTGDCPKPEDNWSVDEAEAAFRSLYSSAIKAVLPPRCVTLA